MAEMERNKTIGVIDYGMGNLRSVSKALERLGAQVYVGDEPSKLSHAGKLVLPGVGAFGAAMKELKKRKLISVIQKAAECEKPLLGICLGLQLFFEKSEESPGVKGLGIWKGSVLHFPKLKKTQLKIPHMGWNQVSLKKKSPLTCFLKSGRYFYFVHSYYPSPQDRDLIVGETEYGVRFPAILAAKHIFAVQFHPEKSQADGLKILRNFIRI